MIWILVAVAAVVIAAALVIAVRRRGAEADGVSRFQRQIDALSPEARRNVVDRVQRIDQDSPAGDEGPVDGS